MSLLSNYLKHLGEVLLLVLFSVIVPSQIEAQTLFDGSFLMSFHSTIISDDDFPLQWQIEPVSEGGRMLLEIQDDLQKKGVFKRVLFNPKDSTWTMLMEIGNIRQGTRIHRSMMFKDSVQQQKVKLIKTTELRIIDNYPCKKIIRESKDYYSEIWVTEKLNFNVCRVFYLLSHCGMMSDFIRKGDWFFWKTNKGMIMEVTSKNKVNGESYTMSISKIQPGILNRNLFNIKGYKISDIPEGQNCGVSIEEK